MTQADLMASFQAEANAERRAVVELLADLRDARDQRAAINRKEADLTDRVKRYLDLNGENELVDDERGIRAFYEERSDPKFDVRSMPAELVTWLAQQGLLSLNVTAYRAARKAAPALELDDVERFKIPEVKYALKVEGVK